MKALSVVITALALLAGCGSSEEGGGRPQEPPADGTGPLVVYTRGGGIAGQPVRLEVGRDGRAKVTTRIGAKTTERSFTLSPDDRATLDDALAEAQGVEGPGNSAGCADCFLYGIEADGVDFELDSVTYTDDTTPVEQVTLVAILEELAAVT